MVPARNDFVLRVGREIGRPQYNVFLSNRLRRIMKGSSYTGHARNVLCRGGGMVDTQASEVCVRKGVEVRVLFSAPANNTMERKRLTITLRNDVIAHVDATIDGATIRNRSHAIESLLIQSLPPTITQAVILAGGPGITMRPLTYELPKAMIPVKGHPILEYTIKLLRTYNIKDIIICIGHLGETIQKYFGDGLRFDVSITYSQETKRLGTGGALRSVHKQIGDKPVLVIYGDNLIDINLRDMIDFHEHSGARMTTALTTVSQAGDWGVVGLRGKNVVSFTSKPHTEGFSKLINTGVFAVEPSVIAQLPKKEFSMLEKDCIPQLVQDGSIAGYTFDGLWFDIATPELYKTALTYWKK